MGSEMSIRDSAVVHTVIRDGECFEGVPELRSVPNDNARLSDIGDDFLTDDVEAGAEIPSGSRGGSNIHSTEALRKLAKKGMELSLRHI